MSRVLPRRQRRGFSFLDALAVLFLITGAGFWVAVISLLLGVF